MHETNQIIQKANQRSKCLNKDDNFARIQDVWIISHAYAKSLLQLIFGYIFHLWTDLQKFCGTF